MPSISQLDPARALTGQELLEFSQPSVHQPNPTQLKYDSVHTTLEDFRSWLLQHRNGEAVLFRLRGDFLDVLAQDGETWLAGFQLSGAKPLDPAPLPWVTGALFTVNHSVLHEGKWYRCLKNHQATTFAADFEAGLWLLVYDFFEFIDTLQRADVATAIEGTDTLAMMTPATTKAAFAKYPYKAHDRLLFRTLEERVRDRVSLADFGTNTAAFQAAIDALPTLGGTIFVPTGDYSAVVVANLVFGSKVVYWDADPATLPLGLLNVRRTGAFSVPQESGAANVTVQTRDFLDLGDSPAATTATRHYGHHVTGSMVEDGVSAARELRGYSFDLGSVANDPLVQVSGARGRVHATTGQANLRGFLGTAEGRAVGFTGKLAGVVGRVLKGASSALRSVGVLGQADTGALAAFLASAPTDATAKPSYGYAVGRGTTEVLDPTVAQYAGYGGGEGDIFLGHTSATDDTPIFRVTKEGKAVASSFRSLTLTVANGAAVSFVPPKTSGFLDLFAEEQNNYYGRIIYKVGASPFVTALTAASLFNTRLTALTGTTGTASRLTVGIAPDGKIYIENRTATPLNLVLSFQTA